MKIALLDINHTTCGVHNNTVPLGIGLIASYLKKQINHDLDIKLFKEVNKLEQAIKKWIPDVVGIAQYCWNTKLNLRMSKLIKEINPDVIIIAGGPNLETSREKKESYLRKNPYVDIVVAYDGEIPFAEIVSKILSGESISEIKSNPVAGSYCINTETDRLLESVEKPPRLDSLDLYGSIYANGIFDEFIDDGYHPFVQTHRGCPFTCAFCHTSDKYYSKMIFQSPQIFKKDLEYLGKCFRGRHDVTLYIANTNMSLFSQDFEIAEIIKQIQIKYNWPKLIDVNSGKKPEKLLEMISIIDFRPQIALQTLSPSVLENIKRINIPFDKYTKFQKEVLKRTGQPSFTELILTLPGETKESFLSTLKTVINSGVQNIDIYTLMNLKGTPLANEEFSENYQNLIKHRIVPRQFSEINGEKIFDTEEVVVQTKDMSFKDYVELRGFAFIISIFFGSIELIPLKKFLFESNFDISEWVFNIHLNIANYPEINKIYKAFLKETETELFDSEEELIAFYSIQENYKDLLSGKKGDNLLRKYKCILLSEHFHQYLNLAIDEAKKMDQKEKYNEMIDNLMIYLSHRDMKFILQDNKTDKETIETLQYNIPLWIEDEAIKENLYEYKGSFEYVVNISQYTKDKLDSFLKMNKNETLSLQILYRDGGIKELWPQWSVIKDE